MSEPDPSVADVAHDLGPSHLGERLGRAWSEGITAFAVIGAVAAFLLQPLLRFMDATALELSAIGIMAGGAGLYAMLVLKRGVWAALFGALPLLAGTIVFFDQLDAAAKASRINDLRCGILQADMLAEPAVRSNAADAFAALGCRPQGYEDVSTMLDERERRARASLPKTDAGSARTPLPARPARDASPRS